MTLYCRSYRAVEHGDEQVDEQDVGEQEIDGQQHRNVPPRVCTTASKKKRADAPCVALQLINAQLAKEIEVRTAPQNERRRCKSEKKMMTMKKVKWKVYSNCKALRNQTDRDKTSTTVKLSKSREGNSSASEATP